MTSAPLQILTMRWGEHQGALGEHVQGYIL
jgi:hypothetical protein